MHPGPLPWGSGSGGPKGMSARKTPWRTPSGQAEKRWYLVALVPTILLVASFSLATAGGRIEPDHWGISDRTTTSPLPAPGSAPAAAAASSLAAAAASLRSGGGPARGTSTDCRPSDGGSSYACGSSGGPISTPLALALTTPNWTRLNFSPPSRYSAAMTYDSGDKYVVLFGGWAPGFLGDTWTYNGHWTKLSPATAPLARSSAMMAYDSKDHYVVLFGGLINSGTANDTWKFTKGVWTQLNPAKSPPKLSQASLVWDSNDSYLVLFGGVSASSVPSSATWTFVGGDWTLQSPATSPSARYNLQMAYDDVNGWVVVFGGQSSASSVLADTWNYSHGHWTHRAPSSHPAGVDSGSLTTDSSDGYLVLFGGVTSADKDQASTWSFVNGTWSKQGPALSPTARQFPATAYDSALGKLVLFGGIGSSGKFLADTWTYHAGIWLHQLFNPPALREAASMTYDEADGYVLLFGGVALLSGSPNGLNDTWTYSHGVWKELHPALSPPARSIASMTYDQGDGYVLLFGGVITEGTNLVLNDTWSFTGGVWTHVYSPTSPQARVYPGMAYDAADGYVVLFGGNNDTAELNDTWTYQAGVWTEVDASGCTTCGPMPSPRSGFVMEYDAWDGYVVLFGGAPLTVGLSFLGDTWTFSGGTWTNISATATGPLPRAFAAAAYDGLDGYVLLFGGQNNTKDFSDTWSFVSGSWTQLNPGTSPAADAFASMAYDSGDHTVVYLAGLSFTGYTWLY